jgi:hypothetical protein
MKKTRAAAKPRKTASKEKAEPRSDDKPIRVVNKLTYVHDTKAAASLFETILRAVEHQEALNEALEAAVPGAKIEKSKDYHYYALRTNPATGAHEYFSKNSAWGERCEYFYPYESLYNSLMRSAGCESALERPRQ